MRPPRKTLFDIAMEADAEHLLRVARERIAAAEPGMRHRTMTLMMFKLAHTCVAHMTPAFVLDQLGVEDTYLGEWGAMVHLSVDLVMSDFT